jgi:hypothetical protein
MSQGETAQARGAARDFEIPEEREVGGIVCEPLDALRRGPRARIVPFLRAKERPEIDLAHLRICPADCLAQLEKLGPRPRCDRERDRKVELA